MQVTSKDNNNNKIPPLPIYFQPKRMKCKKFIFQIYFSFTVNNFYVPETDLFELFGTIF
jgi:hypothetical protein